LGSLVVFLFSGVHINALIAKHLAPDYHPKNWIGPYDAVLPYLQEAFAKALRELSAHVPADVREDVTEVVAQLCEPDPAKRGHPLNRVGHTQQHGLERYISRFNVLATKAELRLIGVKK
jgi:hypothetical protein